MSTTTEAIRSRYTDEQLKNALITATEVAGKIFVRGRTNDDGAFAGAPTAQAIADFHTLLHVLDTLTEDSGDTDVDSTQPVSQWVRAESIHDIRPGDEIKVESDGFIGIYHPPVAEVERDTETIIFESGDYFRWDDAYVVSRIPAPVVHPNPTVDPMIIIREVRNLRGESSYGFWIGMWESESGRYLTNAGTSMDPDLIYQWETLDPEIIRERFDG